jgi:hypothetical protein
VVLTLGSPRGLSAHGDFACARLIVTDDSAASASVSLMARPLSLRIIVTVLRFRGRVGFPSGRYASRLTIPLARPTQRRLNPSARRAGSSPSSDSTSTSPASTRVAQVPHCPILQLAGMSMPFLSATESNVSVELHSTCLPDLVNSTVHGTLSPGA